MTELRTATVAMLNSIRTKRLALLQFQFSLRMLSGTRELIPRRSNAANCLKRASRH